MSYTTPIPRMCGVRVPGGVYATCPVGPGGSPIEDFLLCPQTIVDVEALGLSNIGVKMFMDKKGTYHVLDRVGANNYPNVADVIEEARVLGPSRRLPRTLEFDKLTAKSKLLLVHDRAHIDNAVVYRGHEPNEDAKPCPKSLDEHHSSDVGVMCGRYWWQDVDDPVAAEMSDSRKIIREMPATDYAAYLPPAGVKAEYRPAIFAAFPIVKLQVIKSDDGAHEATVEAASASTIELSLEEW